MRHFRHYCLFLRWSQWSPVSSCQKKFQHDEVFKRKHFPCYCPFVWGIHQSLVNSPHKGLWCGALMFSLICASANGLVNNRYTGDLKCHHAHYDILVMRSHPTFAHAMTAKLSWYMNNYDLIRSAESIDGLVPERRNSIANALELRLSCTNPLQCEYPLNRAIDEKFTIIPSSIIPESWMIIGILFNSISVPILYRLCLEGFSWLDYSWQYQSMNVATFHLSFRNMIFTQFCLEYVFGQRRSKMILKASVF